MKRKDLARGASRDTERCGQQAETGVGDLG